MHKNYRWNSKCSVCFKIIPGEKDRDMGILRQALRWYLLRLGDEYPVSFVCSLDLCMCLKSSIIQFFSNKENPYVKAETPWS
jgi:hypothetical protein